jgi:hypothetical protein
LTATIKTVAQMERRPITHSGIALLQFKPLLPYINLI